MAERERGIAVRGEDRAAKLVDAAATAAHHHHRRARTGAGRQEQRAHDALGADYIARHTGAGDPANECDLGAPALGALGLEPDWHRQHDGAGRHRPRLARQPIHRPEQAHRRDAFVRARHWGLTADVDLAVVVADEHGVRLPAYRVGIGLGRGHAHRLARREAAQRDRDRLIDQGVRLIDDDHRALRLRSPRREITAVCKIPAGGAGV